MSAPLEGSKCRTCLQICSRYHHFEEYIMENNLKIIEMLDEIVPQIRIKIPSQFSQLVCGICVDKLLNGYKFQQLCIETDKRLHATLGNGDVRPAGEEPDLVDPLKGAESFKTKKELNDNVKYECKINPDEIKVSRKSKDPLKSDDAACGGVGVDDGDTDSSNEKLSVLRDRKLEKTSECSEPRKRPKKIRRKFVLPCTECGKVFDRLDSLKRHGVVHAKKREFSCDICKYRFEAEKFYIVHMRIHEKEAYDGPNYLVLTCAICHKSFASKSLFIQHTKKHTKSQNKESKKKWRTNDTKIDQCQSNSMEQSCEYDLSFTLTEKLQYDRDETDTDVDPNAITKQEKEISHHKENVGWFDKDQVSDNSYSEDEEYGNSSKHKSVDIGIGETEKSNIRNPKTGNYPCEICGKVFDRPYRVKRHSSVHSLERAHACELCTYRFSTYNLLKIHMMQHESETGENLTAQIPPDGFKCPDCPRRFESHASLSAHRQIHSRSASEANYSCQVCQSNFVSVRSLTEHITNKHHDVEKHNCDQCEKSFVLHALLVDHLNRHKANKNLVCPICEKEFGYTNTLKEHMRTHSNESSFLCPQCGKTFKSSSNLSQHMKRHFGLKKYQCPECPSRFNCRSDLIKHMSTHRKSKPHECDVCGSRFTRAYSLQKHKSLHTGQRPYKCNQCNMTFAINDHLRRHMRTHTGEKPYKCKYCDRAYAESGDLTKHLRIHVGENTYVCDLCPSAFKYHAELRQHVSEHYRMAHMQKMSEEPQQLRREN